MGFIARGGAPHISNNDPLSRRDAGLEFLNVTSQARTELTGLCQHWQNGSRISIGSRTLILQTVIDTHLLIIVEGLSDQFRLENSSGTTSAGDPYIRVFFLPNGVLLPGQSISQTLLFTRQRTDPKEELTDESRRGVLLRQHKRGATLSISLSGTGQTRKSSHTQQKVLQHKGGSGGPALNQRTTQGKNLPAKAGGTSSRSNGAHIDFHQLAVNPLGTAAAACANLDMKTLRPGAFLRVAS